MAPFDMASLKAAAVKAAERGESPIVLGLKLPDLLLGLWLEIKLASDEVLIWGRLFSPPSLPLLLGRTAHAINVDKPKPPDMPASCICANDGAFPRRAPRVYLPAHVQNILRKHRRGPPVQISLDACQIDSHPR